jgi:hypothetical protein
MLMILPIVFIVGFAFGYLTRARISRRRWAAAQKKYYEKQPEERRD